MKRFPRVVEDYLADSGRIRASVEATWSAVVGRVRPGPPEAWGGGVRRVLLAAGFAMAALMACDAPAGDGETRAGVSTVELEAPAGPPPTVATPEPTATPVPPASGPTAVKVGGGRVVTPEARPTTGTPAATRQATTPTRAPTALAESATRDIAGQVETPRAPGADDAVRAADLATCRAGTLVPTPEVNRGLVEDCVVLLAVWADSVQDWLLNWSAERPISEWDGVKLRGSPIRVREIDLAGRDLPGTIPPALGQLTELRILNLSKNLLVGTIPPELGSLPHLKELRLGQNTLSGEIPVALGRLPALKHLSLFGNSLTGHIPIELTQLASLSHLSLAGNRLSGRIPSELGQLAYLAYLGLGVNRLNGPIPAELGQLSYLTFLDLGGNELTGQIPPELGSLDRLQALSLSHNKLTGAVPAELGQLKHLSHFEIDGNELTEMHAELTRVIEVSHAHPERPCNPGRSLGIWLWLWENQVRWHPDGTTIFFSQGPFVYAAAVDGSRVRLMADANAPVTTNWFSSDTLMTSFDLSPKGDRLVFATCAYRREPMGLYGYGHTFDIAVVDPEQGSVQRLTENETFENYPSWSPDGSQIAFLASSDSGWDAVRNTRLVVMAAGGSGRRLVDTGTPSAVLHPPQWSPDGMHLAFVGTGKDMFELTVGTVDADGVNSRRLGRAASGPAWSPDGTRLAFVTTDKASGGDRILVTVMADETQLREMPLADDWKPRYEGFFHSGLSGVNWISTLAWSPTGEQLLYTCGLRICVVSLDGAPVGQSPTEWWSGSAAAWSPDGTRIAVVPGAIEESGPVARSGPVLYTMAPDGSDVQVLAETGIRAVAAKAWRLGVAESTAACAKGYVVPKPGANPGLVRDCEALVGVRDALFGEDDSNWSPGTPISQWVGVTVDGDPPRVTALEMPKYRLVSVPERPIPEALSALTHLHTLDLSQSRFVGAIPRELMRLDSLAHLDLSDNGLTGLPLPELSRLANLMTLDLSWNRLTGPIPSEVLQLANLRRLDLSGNAFAGSVPAALGHLATLEELSLSRNQLTGSIPPEFGQLAQLRTLDLASNQLTGPVPPELDELANLERLVLSGNDLTGCLTPGLRLRWWTHRLEAICP